MITKLERFQYDLDEDDKITVNTSKTVDINQVFISYDKGRLSVKVNGTTVLETSDADDDFHLQIENY